MISAVVLTKNEERNIKRCLESLSFCDEIVVVDDVSTDKTREFVKKYKNCEVYERPLNGNFAAQHNFGTEKAKGDWILSVDADEVISEELSKEIQAAVNLGKYDGFIFKRRDFFGDRYQHFGETGNVKILRMARKGVGVWHRKVHEVWDVNSLVAEFKTPILHYAHPTITELVTSINEYTTLDIAELLKEGKNFSVLRMVINPIGKFTQNYIFKLGFLDGFAGFAMAYMMSLYSLIVRVKQYENK